MKKLRKKQEDQKEDKVEVEGKIIEVLPGTEYKIEISLGGISHIITGYPSGKMRKNYIKLTEGDEVKVEMSQYDLDKGRVVWKKRKEAYIPNKVRN